jgi:hypothetical protein
MAERGRQAKRCYVYRVFDGFETIYVGKGTGRRRFISAKRLGGQSEILESGLTDAEAFAKEVAWISCLMPTANVAIGGNGGHTRGNAPLVPRNFRGKISEADMRRSLSASRKMEREIQALGSRKYVARFLTQKLNFTNCALWGVSKIEMSRLLEVANGPRL